MSREHDPVGQSLDDAVKSLDEALRLLSLAEDHSDLDLVKMAINKQHNKLVVCYNEVQTLIGIYNSTDGNKRRTG